MNITDIARECGINIPDTMYADEVSYKQLERFAAAIKAAHLEELAGVEMPEPAMKKGSYGYRMAHVNYYTEDQCQQAVASAVARKEIEFRTDLQEVVSGAEQTETKFEADLAKKDAEIFNLTHKVIELQAGIDEQLALITAERNRMRLALNEIASWGEGSVVNGSFDEPDSAKVARAALEASK